jgi:hypothetical protein
MRGGRALARTSRIIAASLFSWPKECPGWSSLANADNKYPISWEGILMTRMLQNRRELLKSAAAISAAASFATIGTTPAGAEGGKKDALAGIDQALRRAAEAKEVPGVVAVAATSMRAPSASATSPRAPT